MSLTANHGDGTSSSSSRSVPLGAVVGAVVGSVLLGAMATAAFAIWLYKRRHHGCPSQPTGSPKFSMAKTARPSAGGAPPSTPPAPPPAASIAWPAATQAPLQLGLPTAAALQRDSKVGGAAGHWGGAPTAAGAATSTASTCDQDITHTQALNSKLGSAPETGGIVQPHTPPALMAAGRGVVPKITTVAATASDTSPSYDTHARAKAAIGAESAASGYSLGGGADGGSSSQPPPSDAVGPLSQVL
jgi:hypothetical protein